MKLMAVPSIGGDLLGAVLEDHVLIGCAQGVGVAEVDLVLAEVALALGVLDDHPRGGHAVADPPDQGLDPSGAEQRIVDVVEVRRTQVAVVLVPGLLVGVQEDHELQLGAGIGDPAALGQPRQLAAEDLAWGCDAHRVPSSQATSERQMTVPSCQGTGRRVEMSGTIIMSP